VAIYKEYAKHRPADYCQPDSRFYLKPIKPPRNETWFSRQPLGKNAIGNLARDMAVKADFSSARITNHSTRKTARQTLLHADVPPASVMQLSGHNNIQSLNSYANLSIDQQRGLSNILSDRTNQTQSTNDPPIHPTTNFQVNPQPSTCDSFDDKLLSELLDDDFILDNDTPQVTNLLNHSQLESYNSTVELTNPPAAFNVSVSDTRITQPIATTLPKRYSFLNGTVHGNITINIDENIVPATKRRRVIADSESEE
jgi:hypothetical protein